MKKLPRVFFWVQEGIKNMCSIKNILRKSSTVLYSDDATQQYMEPWLLKSLLSKSNLHLDHANVHTIFAYECALPQVHMSSGSNPSWETISGVH